MLPGSLSFCLPASTTNATEADPNTKLIGIHFDFAFWNVSIGLVTANRIDISSTTLFSSIDPALISISIMQEPSTKTK
ncbi:hypothetical protein ACN6KS_07095 [Paenibacillus nitricinens]|uniref:hypothetical protein n=1 Tax=Paenibacillus nitricinens TaxID=3367691 RepID=UPI003F86D792